MKKILATLLSLSLLAGLTCLAGCSSGEDANTSSQTADHTITEDDLTFTDRDKDPSYDESTATKITLTGSSAEVSGEGASVDGSTVNITTEGTYIVSGSLTDGSIKVELPGNEDKAQIVLDGVTIHNETGPAIRVQDADKVFLTLADNSVNTLTDGKNYNLDEDDNEPYACIYSKDDLTINGTGTLNITATYRHGIASKDDLIITGGTITVDSAEDALRGNDALKIGGGDITINAGDDACNSDYLFFIEDGIVNVESSVEGYEAEKIYIRGGESNIVSSDDGVNASAADSTSTVDGAMGNPQANSNDASGNAPQGQMPQGDMQQRGPQGNSDGSQGMQRGGQRSMGSDTQSNSSTDGQTATTQTVSAQTVAQQGMNGGKMGGQGAMPGASEECLIQIDGGSLYVNAGGDGLDSNGNIVINGGTVLVSGASNSDNSGLDYEYSATVNGGNVICIGSAGMGETFSGGSQATLAERMSGNAGSTIEVKDSSGKVLVSYQAPKAFQLICASAPGAATVSVQ